MLTKTMQRIHALVLAGLFSGAITLTAADLLPQGARLAIIGDSITEQKLYTKYMEAYLLACAGRQDMTVFQFGWGGETASGFANRAVNDLGPFKPTVATTCCGMNDGQYRPFVDEIGNNYENNMGKVAAALQAAGVKDIVLGSPGAVDTKYFARDNFAPLSGADGYNLNLGKLRDIDRKLAAELGLGFADVHQAMIDAMKKAKAGLGDDYDVCGRDGFHPNPDGHLVMAYAFLRALGCDGQIAQITVDMKGAPAVSAGHKVAGGTGGQVEIESRRYPFCFDPDPKSSGSTRSITPYFPFNDELNRFTLKVKNLDAAKANVTWGGETKAFTREQLAGGVNLVAEFSRTPFDENFRRIIEAVAAKQQFETMMIKTMVTNFRSFAGEAKSDPELRSAFRNLGERLMVRQAELDAMVRKAIAPVKYTITVTPE